jgi:pyruvate kinase
MTARIATKIVCTIGPASSSPSVQSHMIRAGMDVARINFSHGTYEEHLKSIKSTEKSATASTAP